MGRHAAEDEDDDQAPEDLTDPWVWGLLAGMTIALVLVITYALLVETW